MIERRLVGLLVGLGTKIVYAGVGVLVGLSVRSALGMGVATNVGAVVGSGDGPSVGGADGGGATAKRGRHTFNPLMKASAAAGPRGEAA